jgi:hypothetical protein
MTDPQALSMFTFLGLGCVDYPFLLPDLRDELEADERAIERLASSGDEETLAALQARADRLRAAIAEVSGYLDHRAESYRAFEIDRLLDLATRPGQPAAISAIFCAQIAALEDGGR